jgi:hypothetical protein
MIIHIANPLQIAAFEKHRNESPRMVMTLRVPYRCVQFVEIDVEKWRLPQPEPREFFPDFRPTNFFESEMSAKE